MTIARIPKRIIQFWHDSECIPDVIRSAMETTELVSDKFDYIFADDEFMFRHISEHYNSATLNLYKEITVPAARSDLARLMLLHHYGGVYIDCSLEMHVSLDEIIHDTDEIVLARRDENPIYSNIPEAAHLINGFIAAPANSEFIWWCIQQVLANLIEGRFNNRVNLATGPVVINMAAYALEDKHRLRKLSFGSLREDSLTYRRRKGVTNSWLSAQRDGILPKERYTRQGGRVGKTVSIGNLWIHLSFSFLRVKEFE